MNANEIELFRQYFLNSVTEEFKTTKKVWAAVPSDTTNYRPDPKSKTALEIAWHIAATELWFLEGILSGQFGSGEAKMPESFTSGADIVGWYDSKISSELDKVRQMEPEAAQRQVDFFGIMQLPAVMYLSMMIRHSVHHRGQLSAYIRAIGGKVPAIYGGSADEPFGM